MQIAFRTVTCDFNNLPSTCEVFVDAPILQDGLWMCGYGLKNGTTIHIHNQIVGEDSLQALQLAICMLTNTLDQANATACRWEGAPDLGLPRSVRDYALGDLSF